MGAAEGHGAAHGGRQRPRLRHRPWWDAFRRCCCTLAPIAILFIVGGLVTSTWFHGWVFSAGFWRHGRVELVVFEAEVALLLISYFASVLYGAGFVEPGWEPSAEEVSRRLGPAEERPLDVEPPLRDVLQYCGRCEAYKPPRAHHCSYCRRCVLWMDHHCPWTGTCVGHRNLKAFVLFVHYVVLACFHAFVVHSDVIAFFVFQIYHGRTVELWKDFSQLSAFCVISAWCVLLAIMLLVGSLAWEMDWTVCNNMSCIEERITETCNNRRWQHREPALEYPYDIGTRHNWKQVMGTRWLLWPVPTRTPSRAIWPPVEQESGHFDLCAEQLAQRAHELSKSKIYLVIRSSEGWCWCGVAWCSLCCVPCQFGCAAARSCPVCEEPRLVVHPGDNVRVSAQVEHWLLGRVLREGGGGSEGPVGWIPRACVAGDQAMPNFVPMQKELQGRWETSLGREVQVFGVLVYTRPSKVPFTLKASGSYTELLGCRLEECSEGLASWSNGDTWRKCIRKDGERPPEEAPEADWVAWAAEGKKEI